MSLPFRRRSRPRGRARLALTGDFPETGESVTEILERVKPAGYDGTTWPGTGWQTAPVWPGAADTGPLDGTQVITGQQSPQVMTVYPPGPTPQALKAAVYIETEVGVLEDEGDLYDTEASDTITRKAARRLRGGRRPWKPSEEHRREVARIFGGDIA